MLFNTGKCLFKGSNLSVCYIIINFHHISGDLLIIMAQIIVSVQMVYEERVINRRNIHPLAAVGWEGSVDRIYVCNITIPYTIQIKHKSKI